MQEMMSKMNAETAPTGPPQEEESNNIEIEEVD